MAKEFSILRVLRPPRDLIENGLKLILSVMAWGKNCTE